MIKQLLAKDITDYIKIDRNKVLLDVRTKGEWDTVGKPDGDKIGLKTYFLEIRRNSFFDFIQEFKDLKIEQDKNYENPDGESLLLLMNRKLLKEKIAYSETGNPLNDKKPPKEPNTKSVRTSKWKLIINEYNNTQELYDLENDPDEKNNVTGKYIDIEKALYNEFLKTQQNDTT